MRLLLLAAFLIALGPGQAAAEPRVRADIDAKLPILVGQEFRLNVTVLVPNYFLSSPQFPIFDIRGAVVTLPDESGINSSEAIGGVTYAGIRRSYLITPQQAGNFALPPAQITFQYAAQPGKPGVAGSVTLPPVSFTAALPGAGPSAGASALIAEVTVMQTVDGNPGTMKVGDALTRMVEVFAAGTQAMLIPPTVFVAPTGVRIYPRDPVLTDVTTDRGSFVGGRRIDQATYVFEQPGTFVLPSIDVPWIDAASGRPQVARAAAIDVSVAQAPMPSAGIAPPTEKQADPAAHEAGVVWRRALVWLLGFLVATMSGVILVRWFGPAVAAWTSNRRQAWQVSETAAFGRLRRACQAGDPAAAYSELEIWAHRRGFRNAAALCEHAPALESEIVALERWLFGDRAALASPNVQWNGRALLAAAKAARTSERAARHIRNSRPAALPRLNPYGG